jgi:hypothetical protein
LADGAVDCARVGVAGLILDEVGAHLATKCRGADDQAVTVLDATASLDGAELPVTPSRDDAVHLTGGHFARLGIDEGGAVLAAIHAGHDYSAVADLETTATSLGTDLPLIPVRHLTVDGAAVGVASNSLEQHRASKAAVLRVHEDGPLLSALAVAARLGAVRPRAPIGNLAIDGAWVGVAALRVDEAGACNTTVTTAGDDGLHTILLAAVTDHSAGAKGAPFTNHAIDRTTVDAAFSGDRHGGARVTTVDGGLDDRARLGLIAAATGHTALTPDSGPSTEHAVNGAGVGVAELRLREVRARSTAVATGLGDVTVAEGVAVLAQGGALAPIEPFRDAAVDRTVPGVTGIGAHESARGAGEATKSTLHYDGAGLGHSAAGAGCTAAAPCSPARDLAIDRAGVGVADLGLRERGA